ncbi:tripartite tricarboxylate transporter substrate binding protein [Variovorax paradoxus]|uniref:Tripartite tricarboxylate transporter substrate binding protein n=1 Tax=Variovorax paradoxus TaxID=34073 RepID=A0A5Q0LY49_VARPD|nr:tripartite tricarboxylate transporter substrate binding protein [Variovorax paradoxus]QFZ82116.1 tripartite tricarboxylate transporter substrate binding protein [Variovorax paradoxus]
MRRRSLMAAGLAAGLFPIALPAFAQGLAGKTLNLIVPYPAGGGSDINARLAAPELSRLLGQPAIVDNVPGASGSLGVMKAANAPADGSALLLGSPMELMLTPLTLSSARYKAEDFRPIGVMAVTSMVLLARKDLGAGNVDELIALLRRPGTKELSYGSIGPGSLYHLLGERFMQQTGTKMLHVPYKGFAPLVNDLLGGQIDLVFAPLAGNVPDLLDAGKIKALGIATSAPHERFTALAPIRNSKGLDDFVYSLWAGIQVSHRVPEEAQQRLHAAFNQMMRKPELRRALELGGAKVAPEQSLAELRRDYQADMERYRAIAKSVQLRPE